MNIEHEKLKDQPLTEAGLRHTLGGVYWTLGNPTARLAELKNFPIKMKQTSAKNRHQ